MSIVAKIAREIINKPSIIRPHVKVKDITQLDFNRMQEMGMEKIIFCKENVIAKEGEFVKPGEEKEIVYINNEIKTAFRSLVVDWGFDNIFLIDQMNRVYGYVFEPYDEVYQSPVYKKHEKKVQSNNLNMA